jgi:hypothetical protein
MGSSASDMAEARQHAEALILAVAARGGPQLKVWQKPGVGTRVYFPAQLGFVSVSRGGDVTAVMRSRQTLAENALNPNWLRAWRDGLNEYRRSRTEMPSGGKRRHRGSDWVQPIKLIPTGDAYADSVGVVSSLTGDLATLEEMGRSKAVEPHVGRLLLYIARAVKRNDRVTAKRVYDTLSESQTYLVPRLVVDFIHAPRGGKRRHSSSEAGLGKLTREVKGLLK